MIGDVSRWQELATLNNIAAPYTIYPGQVLQLPGGSTAVLPPSPLSPIKQGIPWVLVGVAALGLWWYLGKK